MRIGGISWSQWKGYRAGPGKKRTYVVEVDVNAAIMREYKVSDSIRPLYRLGVIVKGV